MIPFARPTPPRLSEASDALRRIEDSAHFTNFGPVNTRFEAALLEAQFGGTGACLTCCNATLGLMIAIRDATLDRPPSRRYALMPSFTFAAAAHAAMWCGLTPLFCDVDPETWAADPLAEARLIARYGRQIAVIVPYATFGYAIDLARYETLFREAGIPVVVDAAASLGTRDADGHGFGTGFPGAVVFSMHATKTFSTGEGGVVYSGDKARIDRLRTMSNFGFGAPRSATMPGLNAKLSEVGALLAERRLADFPAIVRHRSALVRRYRALLPTLAFQPDATGEQANQFLAALLPVELAPSRPALLARMLDRGVGLSQYFSPHVAEQAFFRANSRSGSLAVTDEIASRVVSLPVHDEMTLDQVAAVAAALHAELRTLRIEQRATAAWPSMPDPGLERHDVAATLAAVPAAPAALHR